MVRKYGLIGYPINHSFSPGYFEEKFDKEGISDARYDLYPLEDITDFKTLSDQNVLGVNVTIPYKETVIPFLDKLSPEAQSIGAVNVVDFDQEGAIGYNTDAYGFRVSLQRLWDDHNRPDAALVLGTGGAAKAVWYVLNQLEIPFQKVSRSDKGHLRYEDLNADVIARHHLIINTTPLGMSPNLDACPAMDYRAIGRQHVLFDLIYNPLKTLFLIKGAARGARTKNGLEMLQLQADRSWDIWNTQKQA